MNDYRAYYNISEYNKSVGEIVSIVPSRTVLEGDWIYISAAEALPFIEGSIDPDDWCIWINMVSGSKTLKKKSVAFEKEFQHKEYWLNITKEKKFTDIILFWDSYQEEFIIEVNNYLNVENCPNYTLHFYVCDIGNPNVMHFHFSVSMSEFSFRRRVVRKFCSVDIPEEFDLYTRKIFDTYSLRIGTYESSY